MKIVAALCFSALWTMAADPAVEKAVMQSSKDLAQAQIKKDKAALDRLLGDELIYSHSSAMQETKADHIKAAMRPNVRYEDIAMSDVKVQSYGNTAVLTCKATYSNNTDGKKSATNLTMLQVWNKRGPGWQLVARWTTRLNP
jgi:hypothetical protein